MRAIEQRPRLEHFDDGFQRARRKSLADLGDHARHLARAQRREHAMSRLDATVERLRNRIRQRLESARRPDDYNVGLHLRVSLGMQLTPQLADLPVPYPLSRTRPVWLNRGHDAPISD